MSPLIRAVVRCREELVEIKGKRAEGGEGGREPIVGEEADCFARGGEDDRRGVEEVDRGAGRTFEEVVGRRGANAPCAEDEQRRRGLARI